MAFNQNYFAPIGGYARRYEGPLHFSYGTADTAAVVETAGYFNDLWDKLLAGDVINVSFVTLVEDSDPNFAGAFTPTAASALAVYLVTAVDKAAKTVTVAAA